MRSVPTRGDLRPLLSAIKALLSPDPAARFILVLWRNVFSFCSHTREDRRRNLWGKHTWVKYFLAFWRRQKPGCFFYDNFKWHPFKAFLSGLGFRLGLFFRCFIFGDFSEGKRGCFLMHKSVAGCGLDIEDFPEPNLYVTSMPFS